MGCFGDEQATWTILVMHHPYLSNGKHGNAGNYDGVPFPPYSGNHVKKMVEDLICNKVDLVFSGHDHSLQVLKSPKNCEKTLFVISGAGASASNDLGNRNPTWFQQSVLGYTHLKVGHQEMLITHRDEQSQDLYQHILCK
ncbi:MAG: hypothetical protein ACK5RO_09015 [Pseudobdellovibrionaceae bacterium]